MGQNNLVLFNTTSCIYILNFSLKEDFLGTFFLPTIRLRIGISEPFIARSSSDGRFIAISMDFVYLYDLKDSEKVFVVPNSENVKHFVFGDNSDEFFFINEKDQVMNYNIRNNKISSLATQKRHPSPITFMTISKDSRFILTVSENPSIIFVQDCNTGLMNKIISGMAFSDVTNAVFHPQRSNIFFLLFSNGVLGFYDVKKPMQLIFKIKDLSITSASFLPNENSSAISIDLNGQISIIDFEKRNVQVKWSIDFFSDLLFVKELNDGGWNVFITSNEKCFYFNQEGLKLSEYSFDNSEKIIQISTLANDIHISEKFSDIVIEKSNLKVSRSSFSTNIQDCSPGEEIQSLDNKFLNSFFLEDNVSKSIVDGIHSEIENKFHKNQNNICSKKELHISDTKISGNNLSIVSIGKENIPLENSTKKISTTNMLAKESSTPIFSNNVFSPSKIHEIRPGFKFETPKSSKKILKSSTKRFDKRDFQINETVSEKLFEKHIETPSTTDIWLKFETNQNTDIKTPALDRLTLGKHVQNSEIDDLIKTSDISFSSFKSQKSDVFLTKELQSNLKKSDFFSDNMLTFKDMLLESQKGIRQDIQNLHVELIKQFMLQKLEFEKILKFKNKEIKNLKKENRKLAHELSVYRGGCQ
ncbi:hypothetical protein PNEG_03099 [Pneumocystis murina B123]|uniref:Uncharacterized protein n=1 Tax=Pneumocystis murina (strain B123) TaxID=1069680 RepID=M7NN15_PNEMU|nr:hypothetical protein PNEG_03099 [Pneumocystis murina B123]EMR08622.1 hypothetical protein PNEG_03099 [Pneumocystis murina B123]